MMNNRLWEEIDEAVDAPAESRAERLMQLVRGIRALQGYDCAPELAYMVVYCFYMHPERLESKAVQRAFDSALKYLFRLDPEHNLGKLYRAFHLFDLGCYQAAEEAFGSVDKTLLTDWQRMKLSELRLCAKINNEGLKAGLDDLRKFIKDAESVDEYDVFPVQLINLLVAVSSNNVDPETARTSMEMIQCLIAKIKQEGIFKEDLRIIVDNLSSAGKSV